MKLLRKLVCLAAMFTVAMLGTTETKAEENMTILKGLSIGEVDVSEMTEEEATTIMTNLANHPIIGPVMTLLETYMGSGSLEEDYTEYNY